MCHHVHSTDSQHSAVHIETMEHMIHIMVFVLPVKEDIFLSIIFQIFTGCHQKARCAACLIYKDAVFDTNEYPGHRRAEAGNIKKSRAFAVPPVIPAEL